MYMILLVILTSQQYFMFANSYFSDSWYFYLQVYATLVLSDYTVTANSWLLTSWAAKASLYIPIGQRKHFRGSRRKNKLIRGLELCNLQLGVSNNPELSNYLQLGLLFLGNFWQNLVDWLEDLDGGSNFSAWLPLLLFKNHVTLNHNV